jgi:hypothetical protein
VPERSRVRPVNVATPLTAATVRGPLRTAPPGLFRIATVTRALLFATRLPSVSSTRTVTAGFNT